ncbi:MAG: Imm52 family immunity protein, partial [Isosphaeraceae bacterium]
LDGRNRGDENNEVIEDLGFSAGMWNGAADGEAVGVTVACGAYPPVNTVGNSVVVRFPAAADGTRDYYKPGTGRAVLEALVECWEPDWAAWTTFEMSKAQGKPRGVRLGWLTYLSPGRRVSPGQIPPPARAEPFHGGTIITIGDPPEPVSGECLNQLREALEDALAP